MMDIDEEIQMIRSKQDRLSVGEQLAKEQGDIIVDDIYRTYFSVIDLVIEDFGLKGDYDCYYEDGVPYMAFRQEDCTFADGYDTELTDGMIVVDLNGMTKDDGCAGYGTAGMSNARYSDKPKKSRVKKFLPELGNTVADVWLDDWGYEEITARGSENGKNYYGVHLDDGGYEFDIEFEVEDIGDENVKITTYLVDDGYNNEIDERTFKYYDTEIRQYMVGTTAGVWREINESLGKSRTSKNKRTHFIYSNSDIQYKGKPENNQQRGTTMARKSNEVIVHSTMGAYELCSVLGMNERFQEGDDIPNNPNDRYHIVDYNGRTIATAKDTDTVIELANRLNGWGIDGVIDEKKLVSYRFRYATWGAGHGYVYGLLPNW